MVEIGAVPEEAEVWWWLVVELGETTGTRDADVDTSVNIVLAGWVTELIELAEVIFSAIQKKNFKRCWTYIIYIIVSVMKWYVLLKINPVITTLYKCIILLMGRWLCHINTS